VGVGAGFGVALGRVVVVAGAGRWVLRDEEGAVVATDVECADVDGVAVLGTGVGALLCRVVALPEHAVVRIPAVTRTAISRRRPFRPTPSRVS
jgi:aconitase A